MRFRVAVIVGLSLSVVCASSRAAPDRVSDPHAATPPGSTAAPRTLRALPASFSFDDLSPTEAEAAEAAEATAAPVVRKPKRIPRPPTRRAGAVSSLAGTPQAVLAAAYRKAVRSAPDGCRLRVSLLAAIGQIESGSVGGRDIGGDHRVSPPIYGVLLDGGPFATIRDSDAGRIDQDAEWDRAVGPLQFIPGTWRWAGVDGDGDDRADPQNVFDAATSAAGYLCRGGRDLSRPAQLRAAIWSYNQSSDYLSAALAWVDYFEDEGLDVLAEVAIRVGSGGRASDLGKPEAAPTATTTPTASAIPTRPRTPTASATSGTRHTATSTPTPTATATSTTSLPMSTSSPSSTTTSAPTDTTTTTGSGSPPDTTTTTSR